MSSVTPQDATATTATLTTSALINPAAIAPATGSGLIIVVAAAAHNAGAFNLASSNLSAVTARNNNSGIDGSLLVGSFANALTSFDPAALTFGASDSTNFSAAAITLALRKA